MKLIELISKNLKSLSKTAFSRQEGSCSYALLNQYLQSLVQYLHKKGISANHRIVLIADHDEMAVLFLAAASILGIQVIMPYNLNNAALFEWKEIIEQTNPDWIIYLKKEKPLFNDVAAFHPKVVLISLMDIMNPPETEIEIMTHAEPTEDFLVLYTSGTTGKPKAISLSESLICKRILSVSHKLDFIPESKIWMSGLINNTTGIIFSFGALHYGATLVFPSSREIETWPQEMVHHEITHIMLRPASLFKFVQTINSKKLNLPSLQVVAYGAASVDLKLLEKARRLLPCKWVQGYGLSETFGPFCWLNDADHKNKRYKKSIYCIGKPDETVSIKVENGELLIQNNKLMCGYYVALSGTSLPTVDWFHTGDYVEFSADGYLNLKGRTNTTLLSENGHRIYPEEIENIILKIRGVDEVLLLNFYGDLSIKNAPLICISGSMTKKDSSFIKKSILSVCEKYLSHEKWPKLIAPFKSNFPKNNNDKVDRKKLAELIDKNTLIYLEKGGRDENINSALS